LHADFIIGLEKALLEFGRGMGQLECEFFLGEIRQFAMIQGNLLHFLAVLISYKLKLERGE